MRLLIVIASYGSKNDRYLSQIIAVYRQMHFDTKIVVLSNIPKDLGPSIEVRVGVPNKNPWSLPFSHKDLFATFQDTFDFFLYSEDDILISERNINAFLSSAEILEPHEVAGFFRAEKAPDGSDFFPDVHGHFHWLPESVKHVGNYTFGRFTNDHSACYILTREHLRMAIASGGFLVPPHEGHYDLLVTAATDPYTQCGLVKLLCLSHLDDFIVTHLPNRYVGTELGVEGVEVRRQIRAMLGSVSHKPGDSLVRTETEVFHRQWSKTYYEACREDIVELLAAECSRVLSIGCGWGATEGALVKKGVRVTGVTLDSVIAECALSRGVDVVIGDLDCALGQLADRKFDGVLISGILHLMSEPKQAILDAASLLCKSGIMVTTVPSVGRLPFVVQQWRHPSRYRGVGDYSRSGVRVIGRGQLARWFREAGMEIEKQSDSVPEHFKWLAVVSRRLVARWFSTEYMLVGRLREG